ncbi:GNAT family N-acetyltransferase [Psychrobacillus sp. OK032]|uniref:GNAT family N-acetyltransferase n=1 Tax=Psychrobacillus sp. OK032 TaxID=1884358 RepID=UPI0008C7D68B|nr:GNAT family N-acetyltransferase [Psychrobacillus sp. OK032]SES42239.1 Acetyltransferase (GNAT) family protein [Psychrobacillus sp. OK032]
MIIRDAVKEELTYIRELRLAAYEEHASKIPEAHWQALRKSILSDGDIQTGVERIVVEIDGEIMGSVALFSPDIKAYDGLLEDELSYPELRMLAISSKSRGKGIATLLINECINRAKEKGFSEMGLHTADFMESAIKLYEHLGFERLPQFDFEPANDGIIVKAFRISF